MKKNIILLIFAFLAFSGFAQKENRYLREGNRNFAKGDYSDAEKDYRKALEANKESVKGQFNLGTAVYQEKNFEESANIFAGLGEKSTGKTEKAEVFHNLGNSLLQGQQYEKSIEAYKQALLSNPADLDSKYNLEYARMKLQQQQQQDQQNKDQNKQDQDKKDEDKQEQDKQDQQQNQDKQDQQKQPPKPDKISKEDAERMLEAMKNNEKQTMEKVKKQKAKVGVVSVEKDW